MFTRPPLMGTSLAFALAILACLPNTTYAETLFPEILYDSRLGPGQDIYTTQGLHYTAGVGWAVSAKAISISFDGVNFIPLVNGTVDFHSQFISSSVSDGFVNATFTGVGGPLPDLIVADETGVLAGTYYYRRFYGGRIGETEGTTTSAYLVATGSLAPFFAQTQGNGRNDGTLFDITPPLSANTFANNFDGHIAGVISPLEIPEPSTLLLFGIGTTILAMCRQLRPKKPPAKPGILK